MLEPFGDYESIKTEVFNLADVAESHYLIKTEVFNLAAELSVELMWKADCEYVLIKTEVFNFLVWMGFQEEEAFSLAIGCWGEQTAGEEAV